MLYHVLMFDGRKIDGSGDKLLSECGSYSTLENAIDAIVEQQTGFFGETREEILKFVEEAEKPYIFELVGHGMGHHVTFKVTTESVTPEKGIGWKRL